jgi:hypothetical protein
LTFKMPLSDDMKFCSRIRPELAPVGAIEQLLVDEIERACSMIYRCIPASPERLMNLRILRESLAELRLLQAERAARTNKVVCITSKRRAPAKTLIEWPPAA